MSGALASVTKFGLSKDSEARREGFSEFGRGRASDVTQLSEDSKVEGYQRIERKKGLGRDALCAQVLSRWVSKCWLR